jgi:hypothetical protein
MCARSSISRELEPSVMRNCHLDPTTRPILPAALRAPYLLAHGAAPTLIAYCGHSQSWLPAMATIGYMRRASASGKCQSWQSARCAKKLRGQKKSRPRRPGTGERSQLSKLSHCPCALTAALCLERLPVRERYKRPCCQGPGTRQDRSGLWSVIKPAIGLYIRRMFARACTPTRAAMAYHAGAGVTVRVLVAEPHGSRGPCPILSLAPQCPSHSAGPSHYQGWAAVRVSAAPMVATVLW